MNNACPDDFEDTERHIFHVVTKEGDNDIDTGKCAIMPRYETKHEKYYIKGDSQMQKGGTDAANNDFYFVANDIGDGKTTIMNLKEDRYLKRRDNIISATKQTCFGGESCYFRLVDFSSDTESGRSSPFNKYCMHKNQFNSIQERFRRWQILIYVCFYRNLHICRKNRKGMFSNFKSR